MKTIDFTELGVRQTLEQLPIGSIAAIAAAGAQDALAALEATVIALETALRVDKAAAVWAVDVVSDVRRSRTAIEGAIAKLVDSAPIPEDAFSAPIGGEA